MKKKKGESKGIANESEAAVNTKHKNAKKINTSKYPKCAKTAAKRESNKEGSIRCKICTFWWHPTCGDLGDQEYKLYLDLSELGHPDLWQCNTCKVGMGDLGLRWEQTGKIVAENSARIDKIETSVERLEARGDKLENELKKTKEELNELKKSMVLVKEDAMKMSLAEMSERENNQNNVVIHMVQESTSNEPNERRYHDQERFQIILRELGLLRVMNTESNGGIKFIRIIGQRKEQETRPMKVGFMFHSQKEQLMESARYLNRIPDLQHISIGNDLTEIQRKEETTLWRKAGDQNLAPTNEMQEKGLVMKVVGPRGQRRTVMAPLRRTEEVDEEGRVRLRVGSRRREGAAGRGQEEARRGINGAPAAPVSGANMEPVGRKEQGNGHGAVGGRSRREEQEATPGAEELEQLRRGEDKRMGTERRFQSSGSGEEERRRKEKGRKEALPFRSSPLLLPRVSTPSTSPRSAASRPQ